MSIRQWLTDRRLKRLESDLKMLRNKISYNPYAFGIEDKETETGFSKRITEYRIWSMGNSDVLRQFYKGNGSDYEQLNYFWRRAPATYRMLHSGIPGLICSKMPRILFGGGVNGNVSVYDGDKISDKQSKDAKELLDGLLSEIMFADRLTKAATDESWGGHCFFKLSHDISVSQYPILETVDIMSAETIKKRGITVAVVFKEWYEVKDKKYRLDETYSTNAVGDATIGYKLLRLDGDKETEAEFSSVPALAELIDLPLDEDGVLTFTGLKGMLAFEKPNKLPSREFPHGNYGASDFEGAIDSFDALDESYSAIISEIRDNRTLRYFPTSMLRHDKDSGEILPDDGFTTNYIYTDSDGDQEQGVKKEVDVQKFDDKTEQHKQKYLTALTAAINNAGLSPFALGITGLEAINSSSESQQERNKVTLETRAAKLELWKPFLEKFFTQLLSYNSWLVKTQHFNQEAFSRSELDFNNTAVTVEFGDYITDTDKQRVEIWGSAKAQGVASVDCAVREIHKDWTEDKILSEVNAIRYEQGMAADNPDSLPDLDGITLDGGNNGDGGVS